jgi:hypothetical protein
MAVITNVRTRPGIGQPSRIRTALASWRRQGQAVSAARHRLRSPALTVGGFICIDAAVFSIGHLAGRVLGLAATGLSLWALEALSSDGGEDQ